MEYGDTTHKGPYYPDVAQIAHKIVKKTIRALDPINLPKPPRGKVLEEFSATDCAPPDATLHEVPLLPRTASIMFPRPCSLRIHRRSYFRSSAMKPVQN